LKSVGLRITLTPFESVSVVMPSAASVVSAAMPPALGGVSIRRAATAFSVCAVTDFFSAAWTEASSSRPAGGCLSALSEPMKTTSLAASVGMVAAAKRFISSSVMPGTSSCA